MGAHARGVVYAVVAAGLASPPNPAAGPEARWQLDHASAEVRHVLRRLPPPPEGPGTLPRLIRDLYAGLEQNE